MSESHLAHLRAGLQTALTQQHGRAQIAFGPIVVRRDLRVVQKREVGRKLLLQPRLQPFELRVLRIAGTAHQRPQPLTDDPPGLGPLGARTTLGLYRSLINRYQAAPKLRARGTGSDLRHPFRVADQMRPAPLVEEPGAGSVGAVEVAHHDAGLLAQHLYDHLMGAAGRGPKPPEGRGWPQPHNMQGPPTPPPRFRRTQ